MHSQASTQNTIGRIKFLTHSLAYVFGSIVVYIIDLRLTYEAANTIGKVSTSVAFFYLISGFIALLAFTVFIWLRFYRKIFTPRLLNIGFRPSLIFFFALLLFIPQINFFIYLFALLLPSKFIRE